MSNEKLGTHYCLYINDILIHYEFSRTAALNVLEELESDRVLREIISESVLQTSSKKHSLELQEQRLKLGTLNLELESLKKQNQLLLDEQKKEASNPQFSESNKEVDILTSYRNINKLIISYDLNDVHAAELNNLIIEMSSKKFKFSQQLSKYIIKNHLTKKYPNISGVVKMEKDGEQWDFPGGFPKKIYSIVCSELDLTDQGTSAKAVGFTPFKEVDNIF